MKAMYADAMAGGELQFGDISQPTAKGNTVLIEIHATSMNPHDWKYYGTLKTFYQKSRSLPKLMLGHDVAGVILEVGPKVSKFKVGDRVFAMSAKTGAFAEFITIDQRMIAPMPSCLSFEEAATIPMAALTAIQALRMAKLQSNSNVLVIGGSGGVGIFAVQIAKARGAHVTAVCSGRNADFVSQLGADEIIDYTQIDLRQCGQSFDIVFDTVGNESAKSCADIIVKGGNFICTNPSRRNVFEMIKTLMFSFIDTNAIKSTTMLAMPRGSDLEEIRFLVEAGKLRTNVDKTFDLAYLEDSMGYSRLGRTRGKIAIKVK